MGIGLHQLRRENNYHFYFLIIIAKALAAN